MEPAVLAATLAIFLFAATSVLTKFIIPEFGGPYSFLTSELVAALPLIWTALLLFEPPTLTTVNGQVIGMFVASSVLAFVGFASLMIGFSEGSASAGGIFISSRIVINIPLAYVLLKEYYPPHIYIFITITFLGALIVSWDGAMSFKEVFFLRAPGARWFFITMVSWGLSNLFVTGIGNSISSVQFIAYRQVILVILAVSFFPVLQRRVDRREPKVSRRGIKLLSIYISLTSIAQILFIFSLQLSLTVTEGIGVFEGAATFLLTMATAHFGNEVLKEPMEQRTVTIRVTGALLSTLGAFFIIILS